MSTIAEPLAADEGLVAVVAQCLCLKDGGDPHRLIWSGQPPEPWGDEWCRYEGEARDYLRELDRQDAERRSHQDLAAIKPPMDTGEQK